MRATLYGLSFVCFAVLSAPLKAETITLNVYALGLSAGTITVHGKEAAKSYAVQGTLAPSALLKAIKDIGYNGTASGIIRNGKFYSRKYAGHNRTGTRNTKVKMHWVGAKPVVDQYAPKREKRSYDITPSQQTGTKDLLTSAYQTFKSADATNLCNTQHHMFDGRRRSLLVLGKPKINGKRASCSGLYKRVAGFSPNDMQKKTNFPFVIYYEQRSDGRYHFKQFTADATFGKVRAIRK